MRRFSRAKYIAATVAIACTAVACSSSGKATTTTAAATVTTTATTVAGGTATTAAPTTSAATATTGAPSATGAPATTGASATSAAPTTAAPVVGLPSTKGTTTAKVMVISDVTQGQIPYTAAETFPAVQLALKDFPNVVVDVCDAKGDQNEYLNCQQKAISEKVNAVVVGFVAGGAAGEDALYQAGIPVLGGGGTTDPLAYSFASGNGNYVGLGAGAVLAGAKKIGVLYLEGTDQLVDAITKGVTFEGGTVVSKASVANNAPDLAPAIAKLLSDGSELIILSVAPPAVIQAMTAIIASGKTPKVAAVSAILPQQLLDFMKGNAEGIYAISSTMVNAEDSKSMADLLAGVDAIKPGTALNVQTVLGFESGYVLATAFNNIKGDVTSANLVAALNNINGLDLGGMVGPASTKPLPSKGLERFMNPYAVVYQVKGGKLVKQGDLTDIRGAFAS